MKDRLRKWGLNIKNVKKNDMLAVAHARLKRKTFEDKDSSFYVNKRPVKEANIDRFLKRKNVTEDTLLSMASPINGKKFAHAF
jgi:chromosome segregation ATPase